MYFLLGLIADAGIASCLIAISTVKRELRAASELRARQDKLFR
jgi:hypothetical protein